MSCGIRSYSAAHNEDKQEDAGDEDDDGENQSQECIFRNVQKTCLPAPFRGSACGAIGAASPGASPGLWGGDTNLLECKSLSETHDLGKTI